MYEKSLRKGKLSPEAQTLRKCFGLLDEDWLVLCVGTRVINYYWNVDACVMLFNRFTAHKRRGFKVKYKWSMEISNPLLISHLVLFVFLISCPTVQVITVFVLFAKRYWYKIYMFDLRSIYLKPNHPTQVNRE